MPHATGPRCKHGHQCDHRWRRSDPGSGCVYRRRRPQECPCSATDNSTRPTDWDVAQATQCRFDSHSTARSSSKPVRPVRRLVCRSVLSGDGHCDVQPSGAAKTGGSEFDERLSNHAKLSRMIPSQVVPSGGDHPCVGGSLELVLLLV